MTRFFAHQDPLLQSHANLIIIGVSSDGSILQPTLGRLMDLYPSNKTTYRNMASKGELAVGDILLHQVQKQATGLGAGNNHTADYVANLVVNTHANQPIKLAAFVQACQKLQPKLFELMRYKNLRHVALFTHNLGYQDDTLLALPQDEQKAKQAHAIWQCVCENLQVPRLTIDVHFDRSIDISDFVTPK